MSRGGVQGLQTAVADIEAGHAESPAIQPQPEGTSDDLGA